MATRRYRRRMDRRSWGPAVSASQDRPSEAPTVPRDKLHTRPDKSMVREGLLGRPSRNAKIVSVPLQRGCIHQQMVSNERLNNDSCATTSARRRSRASPSILIASTPRFAPSPVPTYSDHPLCRRIRANFVSHRENEKSARCYPHAPRSSRPIADRISQIYYRLLPFLLHWVNPTRAVCFYYESVE